MEIIEKAAEKLKGSKAEVEISEIIATRETPWTLTYIEDLEGKKACGGANNQRKLTYEGRSLQEKVQSHEPTELLREVVGSNAYAAIEKLKHEKGLFARSIRLSILSALTSIIFREEEKFPNFDAEIEPRSSLHENLFKGAVEEFLRGPDIAATVGFHWTLTPICARKCDKVIVTELRNPEKFRVLRSENDDSSNITIYPSEKEEKVLPEADVVFITGQTIANRTLADVLKNTQNARTRIIYGPTSSFHPEPLFHKGIDVSLFMSFPPTPEFHRYFIDSRGYWYIRHDIEFFQIKLR